MIALHLRQNHTNAESLLAAHQASRDPAYLRTAAAMFPHDPRVLFEVVVHDGFPEQRREWLERFKEVAPDNALADYLSAREHFKNQQPELAVQDLLAASQKQRFQDFTPAKVQGLEEVHLLAGKPPVEAKAAAMAGVLLPHLQPLRDLSRDLAAAQQGYLASGDTSSAEALARIGTTLGRQLSSGEGAANLLNQMVGLVIEEEALRELPPEPQYDFLDSSAPQRLAAIAQEKAAVREASQTFDQWLSQASEAELIIYFDRLKLQGEAAALSWLMNRQAQP